MFVNNEKNIQHAKEKEQTKIDDNEQLSLLIDKEGTLWIFIC